MPVVTSNIYSSPQIVPVLKNRTYLAFSFGLLSALSGCGYGEWEITELYSQKIEGTSKLLYKYNAWGGRDSNAFGYTILDSSEKFKVNINNNLPFTYLQETPGKTIIKGVSHVCDNSCDDNYYKTTPIFAPIKKEITERQGFRITTNIYQYRGFSQRSKGLERFQFKYFKETRDSLFFYDLDDIESMNGKHVDSLKFKKTDIVIMQNKNLEIIKIVIEDLIIDKNSDEILLNRSYYLTPKSKLSATSFSDYGIFKEVLK